MIEGKYSMLWLLELILGAQEDCALTVEEASNYPHCSDKMNVIIAQFVDNYC